MLIIKVDMSSRDPNGKLMQKSVDTPLHLTGCGVKLEQCLQSEVDQFD